MTAHFTGFAKPLQENVKLIVWAHNSSFREMMRSRKCFPHLSILSWITLKKPNKVKVKYRFSPKPSK